MLRHSAVLAAALTLMTPVAADAQAALTGIVRDDSTARPLAGVEIILQTTNHRALTNEAGRYELTGLPTGVYQVIFRQVGYLPVRMDVLLRDGEATRANAVLVRSEVVLDPIEVIGETPRPRGNMVDAFEERRAMGFGEFIDRDMLSRAEHLRLTDVLQRHSRVEIRYVCLGSLRRAPGCTDSEKGYVAFNTRQQSMGGGVGCPMQVMIDGFLITKGGQLDLRNFLLVHEIHGVEVYRSMAQTPVQFADPDARCGIIVLWTRREP
ncbi:MAG: carboxypeptidase-like regulatory domain-containing protein [Gemmatimonadales bacterium]